MGPGVHKPFLMMFIRVKAVLSNWAGFANFIDEWSQYDFCFTNFGVILEYLELSITTKKSQFQTFQLVVLACIHYPQVAQAHYESPEQHYPTLLINYSYSKKIIRRCMEKYSLLTKLAKCTLNIALKLTFSVFLFFFVF